MGLRCKRCGSERQVKNGLMRGQQRYLCKDCGLNFTDTPPRGKPLALKAAAVLLYVSGLSMKIVNTDRYDILAMLMAVASLQPSLPISLPLARNGMAQSGGCS